MARIALLFVLTAGLASGLAVRAADAAVLRVAAGAADVLATDGTCSLREAVENANDNAATWPDCPGGSGPDEIWLPAGSYLLASTGLALSDEVTLIGAGPDATVIDASGIAGGALSLSADAAIRGLTIQDAPDGGIVATARLTLAESRIAGSGGVGLLIGGGDVAITDCEITGNAAGGLLLLSSSPTSTASVSNCTVSGNGGAPHSSGWLSFGGILSSSPNLSITDSTITANGATLSGTIVGGIEASGVVTLTNVTVSGNEGISAGGIRVIGGAVSTKVDVTHSTIFGNTGVGILLDCVPPIYFSGYPYPIPSDCVPAELDLSHTIVAGNSPDNCDLYDGYAESGGFNLDDDGTCLWEPTDLYADPMLGPLQDNGGPTFTHALLPGSPAINAVPSAECTYDDDGDPLTPEVPLTKDQRGVARPQGDGCDIGAYEVTACADGLDNDGDGLVDYPEDPGCRDAKSVREDPQCQDGINNDGDGLIDFDGGLSVLGYAATEPDPQCVGKPWQNREKTGSNVCGLGAELAFLLPLLIWLRRRRGSSWMR